MKKTEELEIVNIKVDEAHVRILGNSPLIYNAMSEKARFTILCGGVKKNAAARAENAKHDVVTEYRNSMYQYRDSDSDVPTRLYFPTGSFKKAIQTAALDMPGATKRQVGRLCWITEDKVPVYGVPQLLMSVVRSSDMNHTPDVRTRGILSRWACEFTVRSVVPLIKIQDVLRLLAASGITAGVGDWRQEKGSGSYGQFRLVANDIDEKEFTTIVKSAGKKQQDNAIEKPDFYDDETEKLYVLYDAEMKRRGMKVAS
jgi:hypothetical protein